MRLHRLEVTAFGPFAETARVDFDALSDAGLFLLTGATGAGKTSVLDAVCFALYGEVPGDRQAAKRLRCDQAAAGVAPRVELELSLSGRRFRVVRSPAWERPKKRGTGVTTEQASVRFFERAGGEEGWRLLSHRLDETGHLVTHLVGMNLTQFCQVAMLPQGRFQAFLRARSEERHQLLQQLFRTSRFDDIERWLRERRIALRRESGRHEETVADLVSRLSETAAEPLPDTWDLHDLQQPAGTGAVSRWSGELRERSAVGAGAATTAVGLAAVAEEAARAALEQSRVLVAGQADHAAALAEQQRLRAAAGDHLARVDRLATARRAARVAPLHRLATQQSRLRDDVGRTCARRTAEAAALLGHDGPLTREDLAACEGRAADTAATARALLPRETTLATVREEIASASAGVERLTRVVAGLDERLAAAPEELRLARAAHEAAIEAGRLLVTTRQRADALRERQRAGALVVSLTAELAQAQEMLRAAVDEVHHHKEVWLGLQEERINGMAAELAGALAVGADCPVCGSCDHPRKAPARPGAPDAAADKAARRLVDDAEAVRLAHDGLVRDLTARLAVATEQAGDTAAGDLAEQLAALDAEVARLTAEAATTRDRAAVAARVESEHGRAAAAREEALVALAAARAALEAREAEAEGIAREVDATLDGSGAASLSELATRQARLAAACRAALDAATALDHAEAAADAAAREAAEAAVAAGFTDARAAADAALDEEATARLEGAVRDHDAAVARVEALLADPGLRAAAAVAPPDLPALEADHEARVAELAAARTTAAVTSARAQRLAGLDDQLAAALEGWHPVRVDLDLTTRVAALCDGTSPDNRLRMRLSGYVLAWRLSQVVDAANERLARMSDQRYSLEHTGRRGARETRGGLSLLVRDDWSGECRDPATLSGGETFVVSLALALGLADVIAHEVGGAELDTLFVDEGFGSLDADTLDDVMDTLDTLRDGGRVVGVVSHVAEMRDRIPAQLRVTKARSGSTLALSR